ncbi:MAG TPA: carboxypeptidase-like regulatory domain-containing protein, partial [Chthonomonadaceae bacterium]|nr:carboxypeptidase-like regulatory domain-containing protein [Chthonomonadaceae bacterium]
PRTPLQAAPFPTDAPLPPMPWKTRPRSGDLKGFVLTPELNPIDGATVTVKRHGKTWTHRTDGTGFYAFVDLPPGDIVVTLSAPGYEQQQAKATVAAGKVTTVPFTLGSASVPLSPSLAVLQHALPELGATEKDLPVRLQNLIVRIGTDTFPGNLYVQDRQGVLMRVRLANPPLLPFQPGDVVSVNGTLLSVDGETTIDHAVARLTDILPMSALPASKVVTEADLKSGDLPRCACARIQGFVTKASADSLTLEAEGTQIVVPLAGRKEFGVEATGLDAALPARGARVLVEGVLTATGGLQDSKAPPFRLYLYEGSNVKMLAPPSALWKTPILIGVASCCFVLLALPIARKQRLARRRERS